jgi:hypothetical protein
MNILEKVKKILNKEKDKGVKIEGSADAVEPYLDNPIPIPKDPLLQNK